MADEGEWVDEGQQAAAPQNEGQWVDEPQQSTAPKDEGQWVDEKTDLPEPEGGLGTTLRKAAHAVIPATVGLGAFAAASPFGGPLVGIGAGIGASSLAAMAQEKLLKAFGFDDEPQQLADQTAHPLAAAAGDVLGAAPTLGVGTGLALGYRALGAGIAGTTDYIMGGDLQHAAVAAAGGALLNKPTKLGESVMGVGETAGKKISSLLARSKADLEGAANIGAEGAKREKATGATPGGAATPPVENEAAAAAALKDGVETPHNQSASSDSVGISTELAPPRKAGIPSGEPQSQAPGSEQQYGKAATAEVSPPIQKEGEVPADLQAAFKSSETAEAPSKPPDPFADDPYYQRLRATSSSLPDPSRIGEITGDNIVGFMAGQGGTVRLKNGQEIPVANGAGTLWDGQGNMIDPSAVSHFRNASDSPWYPVKHPPPEIAMLKQQAGRREAAANRTNNDVIKGPVLDEEGGTPSPELNEATRQAVETAGAKPAEGGMGGGEPPVPPKEPPAGGETPPPEGPNVTPAEKGGLAGAERGIKRIFGPTTLRGTGDLQNLARETGNEINAAHGKYNQIAQQGMKLLDPHRELVHNMPDQRLNQLVDRQMGGKAFPDFEPSPPEQRLMADLKAAFDQWRAPLAEHDPNQKFRENYLPGLYKNEDVAKDFLRRWASKGDKGMTMEKAFPTYEEAKNAGLDPLTNDPIEMYTRYALRARDFLAAEQFKKDQINRGFMRYFTEPQKGWERIRDTGQMDRPLYAPEDLAAVYNNYVDRGMRAQHEQLYNAIQHGANAWTMVELAGGGYHFVTMGHEGMAHDMTRAVGLAMSGKPAEAASTLLKAPLAPVLTYKAGSRAIADYLDPNHKSVAMDLMRDADVRFIGREHAADTMLSNRKSFLDLNSAESWKSQLNKAWKDVSSEFKDSKGVTAIAGSALKNAARALQTFSHPLFDRYVPYMKAGATIKSVQDFLSTNEHLDLSNKNGPDYKFAVDQVRKIVNSVDNRFGEMISDHLFMNKTLQQSAQVAMRSFSWTLGAMKEIAGGSKSALGGIRSGEGNLAQKLNMKSEHYDPRVAYLIGFPAALAFTSAVTQFLATGQGPGELKDLALPKTGGRVPGYGGRGEVDERLVTPGYMKDVMGWVNHPFQEAYNKLNGLGTSVYETVRGQDSFGRPVVNPKGGTLDQVKDRANYFLTKMGPISYKNFEQGSKTGSHIPDWAAGIGFRPPAAQYQDPEGYKKGQLKHQQTEYDRRQSSLKRIERQHSP